MFVHAYISGKMPAIHHTYHTSDAAISQYISCASLSLLGFYFRVVSMKYISSSTITQLFVARDNKNVLYLCVILTKWMSSLDWGRRGGNTGRILCVQCLMP